MNKGVALATGDVIGFINADDMLHRNDCIEAVVQEFYKTDAEVVYGDNVYVHSDLTNKQIRYWHAGEFDKKKYKMAHLE